MGERELLSWEEKKKKGKKPFRYIFPERGVERYVRTQAKDNSNKSYGKMQKKGMK